MNFNYNYFDNTKLHTEAVSISKELKNAELKLIELLGIINDKKVYLSYSCPNIFSYAEKYLDLKYQKAYDLLKIYNASKKIPELKEEIKKGEIGYTKLRVVLPALELQNKENKTDDIKTLLQKAKVNNRNELEKITRNIAPLDTTYKPSPLPKYLGNNIIERVARLTSAQEMKIDKAITILSNELGEKVSFERFLEILAQRFLENKFKKGNKKAQIIINKDKVHTSSMGALEVGLNTSKEYIENTLETADTINNKNENKEKNHEIAIHNLGVKIKSIPSKIKDFVIKRDGNKCKNCGKQYNLNFHHIISKFEEGKDEHSNLVLLCKACHSLVHQGYLTIEKQNETIQIKYKNRSIQNFNDYLFEEKRRAYLNSKVIEDKRYKDELVYLELSFN